MAAVFGFDAFSPSEIAQRVESIGVAKAHLPIHALIMLGMLAGAFIGLGSLYYVIVASDPALPVALQRVLGGLAFSLGLLLVVVAGAELFTGNNLIAMAWAEGKISTGELLFNWFVVCCANFGVHGSVDVARRPQRDRQGGGHRVPDLGVRCRRVRAFGGEHVLHPARHDAAGRGRQGKWSR